MIAIKRAKRLRIIVTGLFVITAGLSYSLFSPKEKEEVSIIRGGAAEMLAVGFTATPVPSPLPVTPGAEGKGSEGTEQPVPTTIVERKLININTAGPEELVKLPGIGESRAADIIAFRNANGQFLKIEDIMLVKGIKNGLFSKIKDRICTGFEQK